MSTISDFTPQNNSANDPGLTLRGADGPRPINPAALRDVEYRSQIRQWCHAATSPLVCVISGLLDWADVDRWLVLELVASVPGAQVRIAEDASDSSDLFEASISLMVDASDVARCGRGRRAAIEAAALVHPTNTGPAANRISSRLHELGFRGDRVDSIAREIRELVGSLRAIASAGESGHQRVCDVLDCTLVPEAMVVPAGWQLDAAGVSRVVDGKSTQVISTPVVISRRFQNLDHTDIESLEIAWLRDGHWKSKVVTRATVAGTREIIGLADAGLPVTATNAGQLIDYLADFEATNICILSIAHQVARMGWISIGSTSGFMLGKSFLSASPTPQTVLFIGDPGQEQIAAGFHSAGTFEGWRMAVTPLANYPRVQLAFYAGLAAPLLEILDAPNFIFSMAGATSQGKTTALRVVASACGRPDERSTVAAMHTWDLSRTYLERAAAAQSGLPLCVDDTKRVGKTEWVSQILYDIASGRGRGRGSVTGLRESSTWRTVLLTTGEESILSFSQDGGTHARVVQFWGSPFGLGDAGAVVESINRGIVENYGHAGAEFVRQLLLTDHNSIRATYRQRCEHWRQFTDNPVGRRIAGYVAAIEGAEWLAHQFNIVPWPYRNVVTELWTELICQSPDADRPAAAMRYLIEYCVAHKNEFQTRRGSNDAPHGGWLGRWEVTPHNSTDRCLAIFTHRVDKILRDGGYEPDATRRHWRDRGWLLTSENRPTYKVRIDGTTADMVAIRWAAIRDLVGEADIDADGLTTPAPGQRLLHLPGDQGQAAS